MDNPWVNFSLLGESYNRGSDWYTPTTMAKQSLSKEVSLRDTLRNVDLLVNVVYPKPDNGKCKGHFPHVKFPIILITPLALGGKDSYSTLAQKLALSGYVCIVISHVDNVKLQRKKKGMGWLLKEGGPKKAVGNIYNDPSYSINRICDILFVIESLKIIELSVVHLRTHMLFDKISIIGHSYGSLTAMVVAGAKLEVAQDYIDVLPSAYKPEKHMESSGRIQFSWKFPNVSSAIIISPIGPEFLGMNEESYTFNIPCLFFTATNDAYFGGCSDANLKRKAFDLAQDNGIIHRLITLEKVDHGFGEIADCPVVSAFAGWKKIPDLQNYIYRCICAFIDAFTNGVDIANSYINENLSSSLSADFGKIEIYSGKKINSSHTQEYLPSSSSNIPNTNELSTNVHSSGTYSIQGYQTGQMNTYRNNNMSNTGTINIDKPPIDTNTQYPYLSNVASYRNDQPINPNLNPNTSPNPNITINTNTSSQYNGTPNIQRFGNPHTSPELQLQAVQSPQIQTFSVPPTQVANHQLWNGQFDLDTAAVTIPCAQPSSSIPSYAQSPNTSSSPQNYVPAYLSHQPPISNPNNDQLPGYLRNIK